MPTKRTRSAVVGQPDGNSSNVTDYMGPPTTKRQESTARSANPARVTRSAQTARVLAEEPQSKAASTHRKTRQHYVEDEDDDDESVHVAFNQVSSAVNEARLGQARTINGLRTGKRQTGLKRVADDEDKEEGAETKDGQEEALPARKRGRPVMTRKPGKKGPPQNQQTKPNTRSRARAVTSAGSIYHESTPRPQIRSRREDALADSKAVAKSTPMETRQRQKEHLEDDEDDEQDEQDSISEGEDTEEDMQGTAAQAANDSAFIDAPRPDEKLPEVKCTISSLGGMIKTLRHSAWTGVKHWEDDPDMSCSTQTGGKLIECLRQLNDLLLDSCDVRYEGDADGDPAVTIDYLRRNNEKIKNLFAVITGIVDQICTQKLAAVDNLEARGIQTRRRFLSDIARRLIPMLVLVIQRAYELGPFEESGSVVHLNLNSFTIQFPLRTIGWATRLSEALSRSLKQWPIDGEPDQSDEDLDIVEVAQKQGKMQRREIFKKQLASLYLAFKMAANALERQAIEAEKKARQEQYRRQAMIRGRELWAKEERERQEVERKAEQQMKKFAQASQDLKPVPNLLAEMWKQALKPRNALQALTPHNSVPVPPRSKDKERVAPQVEDDDFFPINDNEDYPFDSRVRIGHAPGNHRIQSAIPRVGYELQAAQALEVWGAPRWSKAEEKRLVITMQSDETYNPSTMAPRLRRSAEDVARKAAELKGVYRAIYTKRGVDIPAWAW